VPEIGGAPETPHGGLVFGELPLGNRTLDSHEIWHEYSAN